MRPLWFAVLLSLLGAQTITTTEPALTVCGSAGTFSVTVWNTTGSPLTGVQLAVTMPPGILYEVGSVTAPATEVSTTPLNQPVFGLPNLAPGASVSFTFRAQARCAVLEYLRNPNNEVKNTYQLTWNGGGPYTYTPAAEYNILNAILDYSSITNQVYNAPIAPSTFTRTFTIRNDGDGRIASFRHVETAEPNLEILSASGGTIISHTPHALTLEFNATHFASIGNNDNYFDPGETITFQVQYRILACTDLGSNFSLIWGCGSDTCQIANETGGVSVAAGGGVPNLTHSFPPTLNAIVFTQESSCYQDVPGAASRVLFRLRNAGSGTAYRVDITLFVADYPSTTYRPDMPMRIDTGSIIVRRGSTIIPRTILSAEAGHPTACFSVSNPVKRFTLRVPELAPGETLYVEFDHYICGIEACHNMTRANLRSIGYEVVYRNSCNLNYSLTGGSNYRAQYDADLSISAPDNVDNGQTFNICTRIQGEPGNYTFWFADSYVSTGGSPSSLNYRFEWIFQLPPGLVYTGGPVRWVGTKYDDPDVILHWPATSVNVLGSTVRVIFTHTNRPGDWQTAWPSGSFNNSYVCLPVQVQCGSSGTYTITAQVLFNPNPDCNPNGICYGRPRSKTISINCPEPCPDGIDFLSFRFERISLGLRDDNNDGIPDANTAPDRNLILLNRLMVTDTALTYMEGVVRATNFPFWQYAWALLHLGNHGDRMLPLDVQVQIRRGGNTFSGTITPTYTTAPAGWPNDNRIGINLSTSYLAEQGILPPGFFWQEGDTIRLYIRLRFEYNPGGEIHTMDITPYFYTTTDPSWVNPSIQPHTPRYSCRSRSASAELVGYYFYTDHFSSYNATGCDTLTLSFAHHLSIGPCCANYCSGNLFPYEYRLWAIPDTIYITLPTGWQYVPNSAYLVHERTKGNALGTAASCYYQQRAPGLVEPIDPIASPLRFPLRGAFTIHGGNLNASDDGMWGVLYIKVLPSCRSAVETESPIDYQVRFTGRLNEIHTPTPKPKLYYRGPRLRVEAIINPILARQRILEWRVKVSNLSNVADATHSFLFFQSRHGHLNLIEVRDASTMTAITPTSGYYPIGTLLKGSDREFIVRAELRSCNTPDTLMARIGWSCTGYPASLLQYPCSNSAPEDTLTYILGTPDLVLNSTVTPNPSELCDTLEVTLTLSNGGTAYGYHPALYMILPHGTQYVPGSAQLNHAGTGWVPTSDPTVLFGIFRVWNLANIVPSWAAGMPDTLPGGRVEIRFRMTTTCNYITGAQVRFYGLAFDLCDRPQYRISASPIVALTNVVVPYAADIQRNDIEVRGCDREYTYTVEIINRGAGSTTPNDSVRVTIPGGVYVPNSTFALLNFTAHNPQISTSAAGTVLTWGLPAGINPSDTIRFRFSFRVASSLPSGVYPITVQSVINATRNCGPLVCSTFYPTGTQNASMTVIRPSGLWTGEIDRDWFKAFNWGDCRIPDCAVDVVIPDTLNEPLILGGTASCRDITIQSNSSLEIGSTGELNICRDYTLEANAQLIAQDGSIMRFVGSTDQRYVRRGAGDPWNVEITQAVVGRRVILLDELIVRGTLTLNTGVIDGFSHNKETFTTRPSASALNAGNLNSYVSGILRRNINTNDRDDWYHLPVGHLPSGKGYQLAQVRFNATPTVSQLLSYFVPNVITNPVIQTDCGGSYGTIPNLNHGYWVIRREAGTPSPYHLRVYARGYTNAIGHPEGYTIVKRPDGFGGNMSFEGICEGSPFNRANQTGRRNLSDFSEFGVAQSPTPLSVQFIRVHATPQSSAILLSFQVRQNWSQLQHHEIERSEDGIHWQKVAELPRESYLHREGDVGSYRWQDSYVQRGQTYFYRIRAVESSGNIFLSPVVEATLPLAGQFWARIVPNPSHEEAWLETSEAGHTVRVWDAAGKLVWEGISADRIALPSDKIGAGVYVVEVGGLHLRWVKQ